ncbi:MAG: hypothetical protein HYZ93_03590 [Candidatus Omnitrophica bacterium]|nr:hypothetical protein [Candidatus Omnitrophota bacterium]
MKRTRGANQLGVATLLAASLAMSGCALFLVGAGAAGGYAASRDSVKNQFDLPKDFVFQQGLAVAKKMGQVTLEDPSRGEIRAYVNGARVTITVKPLTRSAVELKVKARKSLMPAVDTAQQVYNQIATGL